ncbi:hexapeptide transferase [Sphingomonas sp. 8AM]|uniref:hexapeptide transferase n=1 Tax=Sphingomonas sp. 8AM TaxID=2653170 RepID=UPI0012F0CDE1|nr:hexapeptide transferase [Sphingomonas sp. 8AM]VXD01004.1 Sugar O-acyltransferase, sialic acid O-acetyltransferase NeuD family [Sphingomonas sp. 8AM]
MSKERLILVGGGGFCRELYFWASECHAAGRLPPVGGYLDDAGDTLMGFDYPDMPWLGGVEAHEPGSGDRYVLAVGHPRAKRALHGLLATRGAIFPRLIHPSARVLRTAALGEGVIFCPGSAAGPDTKINRFVTFNAVCGAGHDAQVGEFTTISSAVDITGGVQIGKDVMIGSGVTFLPRIKVGDGATIGAGCTVYRSVPAGATAYTQPAKILRTIRKDPS